MWTYRGPAAELVWLYVPAAVLGSWTITTTESGSALTAAVVSHDAYAAQQQPLTFRVRRQHAAPLEWRIVADSLHIASQTLTAQVTQK